MIQANANVALLAACRGQQFDYWLRLSTLEQGHPVLLPVKLADYHRQALAGKTLNTSTILTRKADGWWLTLSYDETRSAVRPPRSAPVIGVDVGIANFITTSTGKHYGTFNGKLAARHKRDREKAPPQGQTARLPEEEGRAEAALYPQPEAGAAGAAGDQSRRQRALSAIILTPSLPTSS